ncbi:LysR family transcriptional regulator [Herbaspirillum sp. DW155]|uniref:LysR family transcriptional regulator n=1 Tax=Herbaspirillum sp. DW155 TaxID=3095609 RepID=UPI0030853548|nr:LysR family transcriptional regulator [Herbaspirillum sp. DW155]
MKQMNIGAVDLNLLKTFIVIWELRSLTAAADRLHLTQPAVSHALRRLREMFDDPLFVRSTSAMVPTETAIRLHEPIARALGIINEALHSHASFDPATATRTFHLVMSDMSCSHVLPLLMEELAHAAPHVSLEVQQMAMENLGAAMRNGDIDLAFGYLPGLPEDCQSQLVLYDDYVCMLRKTHPLAGQPLTMDNLLQLRYVYASTNTTGHQLAEDVLRNAGARRDFALRMPHFTVAPQIVRNTDLALFLPRSIAERHNLDEACVLLDLPLEMPRIPVSLYTHARFAADSGIQWLRSLLIEMFGREAETA